MPLSKKSENTADKLREILNSDDVEYLPLSAANKKATLVFIKDIVDKHGIGEFIIKPLNSLKGSLTGKKLFDTFLSAEKKVVSTIEKTAAEVVGGNTVLLVDGFTYALSFGLKMFEKRAITEPPTSSVIKGPREGFVESLQVNVSLMRRKLKTESLKFININVGNYSNTQLCLCYIDGIADKKLVSSLKERLQNINIDALLDSSYVSKYLGEKKSSIFKQVGNTEKPDILAAKILEGRVAILVDGSPIVLTIPYLLIEDFQSPSDYYNSPYTATFMRVLRLISVLISMLLPAVFVAAELFHLQLIPLSFLLTIVNSIKGIPLSPSYEMFFTLLIFEILNEASLRMPRYVGMVVSIVGALVLGETAVNAGIISAPALMIIAFSGICLYTVPELEQTFSLLRLIFLIIGGSIGGYGIIVALSILLIYLISFENFGTPIFAPFSPIVKEDLKDGIYKGFMLETSSRPKSIKNRNKRRLKVDKMTE